MAYMRGDHYVWNDGGRLHLWARDGYDGWNDSVWADGAARGAAEGAPMPLPSGVGLVQEVVDEYVVMRLAELVEQGLVAGAIHRALANHGGNGGCATLVERADSLVHALGPMNTASPAPQRDPT